MWSSKISDGNRTSETMFNKTVFDLQQEIGYAFPFQKSTDQMINTILNSNWSGKHWSDRLWTDNRKLTDNLVSTLSQGISQGKSYYTMARELKESMTTGEFQAVRLIRTEATFVANQAKLIALKNSGVDEFEYVAVLDARTSDICQEHDGAIVTAKQAVFGLTLPPLHPNCRSTFIARIPDEMKVNLKRMALNPVTGKKELIPRSMTYKEWKQSLYEQYGRTETDISIKKIKNSRVDSAQYELYKKTVGSANLPGSIEAFQEMKYTNPDRYMLLQNYKLKVHANVEGSFSDYERFHKVLQETVIGTQTKEGIIIERTSIHTTERAFVRGINPFDIKNDLEHPLVIGLDELTSNGKISRKYTGTVVTIPINPVTKSTITVYKTPKTVLKKLLKEGG